MGAIGLQHNKNKNRSISSKVIAGRLKRHMHMEWCLRRGRMRGGRIITYLNDNNVISHI